MARKKFNNVKVTDANDITHDSGFEYTVYMQIMQEYPRVWRQVSFDLMDNSVASYSTDGKRWGKKPIKPVTYIVDFVVENPDGALIAIEAKGYKTQVFKNKVGFFVARYLEQQTEFLLDSQIRTLSEYQIINMKEAPQYYRPYTKQKARGLWD